MTGPPAPTIDVPTAPAPCPWCGQRCGGVQVHGHAQCAACGTNIDPCCSGEMACVRDAGPSPSAPHSDSHRPKLRP